MTLQQSAKLHAALIASSNTEERAVELMASPTGLTLHIDKESKGLLIKNKAAHTRFNRLIRRLEEAGFTIRIEQFAGHCGSVYHLEPGRNHPKVKE